MNRTERKKGKSWDSRAVRIFGDSSLTLNQVTGRWACNKRLFLQTPHPSTAVVAHGHGPAARSRRGAGRPSQSGLLAFLTQRPGHYNAFTVPEALQQAVKDRWLCLCV